ncbi:MAG: lytic transglycosylase domain-containing protein [Pyrinomonadaceae bacterium]
MRISVPIILLCLFAAAADAQGPSRVFDNFDTARGVRVYVPPPPPPPEPAARTVRKRVGGRWVVVVEDNLVKKTGQTSPANSAADRLAPSRTRFPETRLAMGSSLHLKGFSTGNPLYDSYIVESSQRYRIDPLLIYAQMHQESTFNPKALSPKGASGLMQLMPATARRFGVTNIYDPRQNIDAGVKYMRWLLDTFNQDVVLALAGYNAGEGAVMKYGNQVPPYRETQEYVRRITSRYRLVSDPKYVSSARRVSTQVAERLEKKESRPLYVFEPGVVTIRLADGSMRLVNQ